MDLYNLKQNIKRWAIELGFQDIGVADLDLSTPSQHLKEWLENQFHGTMGYMERHAHLRSQPEELHPGTVRVISARMNYLPEKTHIAQTLGDATKAYVSRYALGKDYHKLMRKRLAKLANKISASIDDHRYRVFCDSAPVLERALAEKSGLGWIGKNTMLLDTQAGSWFFLGEIYTNIALPIDKKPENQCGACKACLEICPTNAFVKPYQLDAKRCISYLTIEYNGIIDKDLRENMGNRIYGCDDCQLVCPWNRYASHSTEVAFSPRDQLDQQDLLSLFAWTEADFLRRLEGSPIRRIGYQQWIRNIAIALGNSPSDPETIEVLQNKLATTSLNEVATAHIRFAIEKLQKNQQSNSYTNKKLLNAIAKLRPDDA